MVVSFDTKFDEEISKVFSFMTSEAKVINQELHDIDREFDELTDEERKQVLEKNESTKSSYRKIRALYIRLERLKRFFRLNEFAVQKMGKKFDKIVNELPSSVGAEVEVAENKSPNNITVDNHRSELSWECFSSYITLSQAVPLWNRTYEDSHSRCVQTYTNIFRQTHENIAEGELRFFKQKEGNIRRLPFYIGYKIGFVCALVSPWA
jgi:SPX domain protein involved in polyphosphate accumulation